MVEEYHRTLISLLTSTAHRTLETVQLHCVPWHALWGVRRLERSRRRKAGAAQLRHWRGSRDVLQLFDDAVAAAAAARIAATGQNPSGEGTAQEEAILRARRQLELLFTAVGLCLPRSESTGSQDAASGPSVAASQAVTQRAARQGVRRGGRRHPPVNGRGSGRHAPTRVRDREDGEEEPADAPAEKRPASAATLRWDGLRTRQLRPSHLDDDFCYDSLSESDE